MNILKPMIYILCAIILVNTIYISHLAHDTYTYEKEESHVFYVNHIEEEPHVTVAEIEVPFEKGIHLPVDCAQVYRYQCTQWDNTSYVKYIHRSCVNGDFEWDCMLQQWRNDTAYGQYMNNEGSR